MKTLKAIFLSVLLLVGLSACSNNSSTEVSAQPVDTLMMSQDSVNAQLAKIMNAYVLNLRQQLLTDTSVLTTIAETQTVIQDIEKKEPKQARNELQTLIGKLEVLLTKNPNAALVPVDVRYRKVETINNIDSVKALTKRIDEAVEHGYYQAAKIMLSGLTSEMIISTVYIPVIGYLNALKSAAVLMDESKIPQAMVLMQQALSTVVVTNISIPLPVLRAQIFIAQAAKLDKAGHQNAKVVMNLLENAKYQLKLAEAMGYGKRDKEYKQLYKAIKELEKSVKNKQNSQPKFEALKKELESFKNRLFPVVKKSPTTHMANKK